MSSERNDGKLHGNISRNGYGNAIIGRCNAPDSMRQVSASYSSLLPCHFLACCILSCHHVHFILHTCSFLASEHFPRCPFCNPALLCHPMPTFAYFHVRVLNFLGMDRDLPSGLGISPVDRPSNFVPFGGRLMPQLLTELTETPFSLQPSTSSHSPPRPYNSPPCSPPFNHDRMAANRT